MASLRSFMCSEQHDACPLQSSLSVALFRMVEVEQPGCVFIDGYVCRPRELQSCALLTCTKGRCGHDRASRPEEQIVNHSTNTRCVANISSHGNTRTSHARFCSAVFGHCSLQLGPVWRISGRTSVGRPAPRPPRRMAQGDRLSERRCISL